MEKLRLDQLLVERELVSTRQKARALIMEGRVLVNDEPVDKAGTKVAVDCAIRLRGEESLYVSRGGEKIAPVLEHFNVSLDNRVVLDVGASTGGFTDCMLQRGARMIYAVDVGYNQLDLKLRRDSRVVVMERTHVKSITEEMFPEKPSFATIDVSFIGLRVVLPWVVTVLEKPFGILALVKPQFELGPEYVSKGGVVRKLEDQLLALRLVEERARELKLDVIGNCASPLKGEKKGNQEYFVYCIS